VAYQNLIVETKDRIGIIKINRPKALNALNTQTIQELENAVEELSENPEVRAIVLTGEGKAFVAGADISEMKDMTKEEAMDFSKRGHRTFSFIESQEKPVIAAVNGFALGGGCELAMACDIRIASDSAKFGQPEVNLGVTPGFAGTQRLLRLVGTAKAKELIYTGDIIDSQTALSIGLVNQVIPGDKLLDFVMEMANKIASKGPVAVKSAKKVINKGSRSDFEIGSSSEVEAFSECFASGEAKEGMSAFLEKRSPKWS
jgi:enoyl-CoA hydratase